MRSDLIFGALAHVTNRYTLCQLASKATRKLHKPNTRLQDTTNEVLVRFHHESPAAAVHHYPGSISAPAAPRSISAALFWAPQTSPQTFEPASTSKIPAR